jgi:cytochrome c5
MKKVFIFLAITLIVLIGASSFISKSSAKTIPDDLNVVFKASCMVCHAEGGKGMAKMKLNFSEWNNYDSAKQAKKAVAICKVVSKESMPPKSFLKSNPKAALTQQQKEEICKWSDSLNKE